VQQENKMSLINGPKEIKPKVAKKSLSLPSAVGMMAVQKFESLTGVRFDPAPAYLFYVEISGIIVGMFTECSGIGATRSIEKFSEGGLNDHTHSLPGPVEYGNITLKRGISVSRELWNWFHTGVYDFQVKRLNISIIQGAPGHNLLTALTSAGYGVVKRWNVDKAFPASWRLSDLNVKTTDSVAIETLEIAHAGVSLGLVVGTPMTAAGAL
jgi:phage tail-like protein